VTYVTSLYTLLLDNVFSGNYTGHLRKAFINPEKANGIQYETSLGTNCPHVEMLTKKKFKMKK